MEIISYDLAIIGSGIACSRTLCELAERLKAAGNRGPMLRIGIIERGGEMWSGVPYGMRSAIGALAFQRLQEFLEEPERSWYISWLMVNADRWLRMFVEGGGPGAAKWIADNHVLIEQGKWEELYLPRFVFGMYVSSQAARAVEELATLGLANVMPIHGEAVGMCRTDKGHHIIDVENHNGGRTSVHAARVVVAIGSPPQKRMGTGVVDCLHSHTHIHDLYSPSEDINVKRLEDALSSLPHKRMANLLIVGSNASSLELLYLINYRPEIRKLVNSVVVLSRSGSLPYKICEESIQFELSALEALGDTSYFSAADLMAAIQCDLRRAEDMRVNIADLRDPVGAAVSRLTALLHVSEQKKFVCEHGIHFSRMMRRAGRDTRNAADQLVDTGILSTVKGEFRGLEPTPAGEGLVFATYASVAGEAEVIHPVPFRVSVNCGGFEELDVSSSRLIKSLIANKLCRVNSTNRGFQVTDRLEASENVYVIGPLVAGNFNEKLRFWHVESASRIVRLAKVLAESLVDSLLPATTYSVSGETDRAGAMVSTVFPQYL